MNLSYYGWCCGADCREEATARVAVRIGDLTDLRVPVCADHLARAMADITALRGHDLVVLEDGDR